MSTTSEFSDRAIAVAKKMQDLRDPAAPSDGGYHYDDAAMAEQVLTALALVEPAGDQIITSEDALAAIADALDGDPVCLPVVLDHRGEPWITYPNEDGDWYAVTTPVEGTPYFQPMPFGQLISCQPDRQVRLAWTSARTRVVLDRDALVQLLRGMRVTVNDEWKPTETSAREMASAVLALVRLEHEVKAEALREAADSTNWAKVMSPYRSLRERADDLEAGR